MKKQQDILLFRVLKRLDNQVPDRHRGSKIGVVYIIHAV